MTRRKSSNKKVGYVDGFVLVVPKKNVTAYKKMAREAAKYWMRHGALAYRECMLDDAKPKFVTFFFPRMAKAKPADTVWYSYIEYRSRRHRDAVNKKVMADMDKPENQKYKDMPMPFDMKRMAYGGFSVEVDYSLI